MTPALATRKRRAAVLGIAAVALLGGVGASREAALARGAEILAPFKRELQRALADGLARGPVEALSACRIEAPRIAASLSSDGVEVGRTSHRLRNPANAPRPWVQPLLDAWVAGEGERAPRVVRLANERWGYVEPITVQPLCLPCHGEAVAQPVRAGLAELYPRDRAVGFRAGDFRGLFWAEFPDPPK